MVKAITDKDFQHEVLDSKEPVLIDFWAEWCGPCKMLAPILDGISLELQGKIKIVKMDIESNPSTPSSYHIRSLPTMIIFKDGQQIAARSGVLPKQSIIDWINSSI